MLHSHFLWFCTSLTLYFSLLLIISIDGANSMCCLLNWGFLHCVSRSLLNTLCITYSSGNFSWNTSCLIFFVILKDPCIFWSSFFENYFDWMFFSFHHMLFSCFNSWELYIFLLNCLFMASFAFFIDVFAVFQLLCSFSRKVYSGNNWHNVIRIL